MQFIEAHDYRPNVMAKGLAQRKTYNIALLLPKDYAVTEFPFFKECMQGICEVASEYDYDVIISMLDGEDLSQIQRLEWNRKVDGIILSRAIEHSGAQDYLKQCREPFVVIGPAEDKEVTYVDNRNQEASRELTEGILKKGVSRLALLGGSHLHGVTGSRYRGYIEAHQNRGIPVEKQRVFFDCDDQEKVADAVDRMLQSGAEGIICMDDDICGMCLGVLREKKIRIPEELCVASLYDSKNLEYNNPPITSVRFDTVRLGKLAAKKLLKMLGENVEEDEFPLRYQVIQRKSTR